MGHTKEARTQFVTILHIQPENPKAHLGMANVHYAEQDWARAVAAAQGAKSYGGPNFAVLFLLGLAARKAGNNLLASESLAGADALIEKTSEMTPDSPEAHYLRGEISRAQAQYGPAMDHYRAAEDRAKPGQIYSAFGHVFTRSDILARRGQCLVDIGNPDGAREIGKQIIAADAEHAEGQRLSQL